MSQKNAVYDCDTHFTINPVTRIMRNDGSTKSTLIQHDHNSERITFELPRYIEGYDMLLCNAVEVHYNNIDTQTKEQCKGLYDVTDLQVSPADESVVVCSWLISNNATRFAGTLNFLVRFCTIDDRGKVVYAWNTMVYSGLSVSNGIYNTDAVITNEHIDILEQWREELFNIHFALGKASVVNETLVIENEIDSSATLASQLLSGTFIVKQAESASTAGVAGSAGSAGTAGSANKAKCDNNNAVIHETYLPVKTANESFIKKTDLDVKSVAKKASYKTGLIKTGSANYIPTRYENRLGFGGIVLPKSVFNCISRVRLLLKNTTDTGTSYMNLMSNDLLLSEPSYDKTNKYYLTNCKVNTFYLGASRVSGGSTGDPFYSTLFAVEMHVFLMWDEEKSTLSFWADTDTPPIFSTEINKNGVYCPREQRFLEGYVVDHCSVFIDYIPE